MPLPVRLSQHTLQHLACGVPGQIGNEIHGRGTLESSQLAPAEVHDLLGGGRGPLAQDDDGLDRLAPLRVGNPNHRAVGHRRMGEQDILHHAGIDVLSAGYDHVLDPVLDVHETLVVNDSGVAGVHPASPQGFIGLLRQVPVSLHHLGAFDDDLADGPVGHVVVILVNDADFRPDDGSPGGEKEIGFTLQGTPVI